MGRYDLRLRSIYGPNELTGGEQLQHGIGAAIAEKETEVTADNARRAQGQVMTGQTGVMDRLRTAGSRVAGAARGIAGMIHPEPQAAPILPSPAAVNAGIAAGVTPITQPAMNSAAPGLTSNYSQASTAQAAPPPMTPAQHGLVGARPAGAPGIASAIQPYDEQDTHGNTWSVDPLHAARVKDAGDNLGEEDKIAALTAAGMPAAEARARVKTNTVQYDQTFGRQMRPASGFTFEQRKQLQDEAIAARSKLAGLARSGRTNTEEYRQLALHLRERELDLRAAGQDQTNEGRYVTTEQAEERINYGRGKAPDPISASMETPQAKLERDRANIEAGKHAKNVATVQQRRANAAAPRTQASARAKALKAAGKTPAQITEIMQSEGYKVSN